MKYPLSATDLFTAFVHAFENVDAGAMRQLLSPNVQMGITNAQGGVDVVTGIDKLLQRITSIPYEKVDFRLDITQVTTTGKDQVLGMVHVTAHYQAAHLQNFAAFLCQAHAGRLTHIWMVEAEPQKSDAFWKSV